MLAEDRLNAIVSMVQQTGSVTVPFGATCRRSTEHTVSPRCTEARQVWSART